VLPIALFILGFAFVFALLGGFTRIFLPLIRSEIGLRLSGAIVILFGLVMLMYALRVRWPALYAERRPLLVRVRPGQPAPSPWGWPSRRGGHRASDPSSGAS
jgi:cytochrome c biogenesis protein CcdA